MNYRVHADFNNTAAAEEAQLFSGVLAMSVCCLCCIGGTGGHFSCASAGME